MNERFFFLMGKGKGLRFEEPAIHLQVCKNAEFIVEPLKNALKELNQALVGKRVITYRLVDKCMPFTDLNSRTLQAPPGFDYSESTTFKTLGYTLVAGSTSIVDADVLINYDAFKIQRRYLPEYNSETNEMYQNLKAWITLHEMSHFMGLGHNFDENGHHDEESVMCYGEECQRSTFFTYDKEALQELYK